MAERSARPTITAVTGLRAVAAAWVVSFHYRDDITTLAPLSRPLRPLFDAGYLGVDIFFVLSGFVLAYNYADPLSRWHMRRVVGFLRNRLARVWPVHLLTLHLDLLQAALIGTLGVTAGGHRRTFPAYLENLTMTHAWWNDRPSFNAPAWSISAEWAAYLATPLLLLALTRVRRTWAAALLAAGGYAGMLAIFALFALPNGNVAHAGMLRLAAEFCAGIVLLRVYQRHPHWLGRLALPLAGGITASVFAIPEMTTGYWLAPAFGLFVICLATSSGPLSRLLATRPFVFWGKASYSLYMTHVLLQPVLHRLLDPASIAAHGAAASFATLLAYAATLGAVAVAVHHLVEVPARERLRTRRPTSEPTSEPTPDPSSEVRPARQAAEVR